MIDGLKVPFTALVTVPGTNVFEEAVDVPIVDSDGYEVALVPFKGFSPVWLSQNGDKHWSGHPESNLDRTPEEVRSLAFLFASAPTMLAALRALDVSFAEMAYRPTTDPRPMILQAIAKAEGRA